MVDGDQLRTVMGNFAAGVTVVTLPEPNHGITVNAFASVSLSPPLVLICIDHDTETHERLTGDTDGYCVNVLAGDQQHLGEHFARMAEHGEPFVDEPTRVEATGAPVFEDALAYLDCSVFDAVEAGDHTIYVGEVEAAGTPRPDAPALTYFRGKWGEIDA
jgi:flavin reductase (DIM6/NTAB) family NADH-FMN oxidoreductase RutF